jgi:hypothetical protein
MSSAHNAEPGKGVLFQNNKKHDRSPDYTGLITLSRDFKAGDQVKLAAWTKRTAKGSLLSLSEDNYVPPPKADDVYPKPVSRMDDDDIPFN